ncbi:MAG: hypothetical protein M3017_01985 [Actinomycetota bacterium]|nr:hypothetical protein [Actinomycetota bacterium]
MAFLTTADPSGCHPLVNLHALVPGRMERRILDSVPLLVLRAARDA